MSKEKRFLLFGLIAGYLAIFASAAYADGGGFVPKEEVPPIIPYQRAFLSYSDGHELMVVQTKFEGRYDKIGWVVPLPNPPKIATFGGESYLAEYWAEGFFAYLGMYTHPYVVKLRYIALAVAFLLCLILLIRRFGAINGLIVGVLLLFVASILIPSTLGAKDSSGVEVLEAKTVGDYDTKTIKATDGNALIEWLNKNGFKYSKEDEDVFNSYISKGWVFATAIINSKASSYDLLTPPLVVWFETKEMVYPLVLTATESKETEILLYTYSPTKMKTDERFVLECAEKEDFGEIATDYSIPYGYDEYKKAHEGDVFYGLFDDIPEKALTFKNGFIQKFRGRLTPDKMKSDLVFQPAGDETPYRKHIYKW